MKTTPTGFQAAFLLLAITFAAMLVSRPVAVAIGLPDTYFNTLGHFIVAPLELAFIFGIPALRHIVLEGYRHPFPPRARMEAAAVSLVKISLTFGVWAIVALFGLHVSRGSSDIQSYGFLLDRGAMDERYFAPWGLINAIYGVSLGPFMEELVYRGVLFRLWERQWGWIVAALLSSIAFSIVHPHNLIPTFLSGILYACVYRRTGSLWAPTLCHAIFNVLITWPLLGQVLILKPAEAATSLEPWIPNLVCLAVGTVGFVLYVGWAARNPVRR